MKKRNLSKSEKILIAINKLKKTKKNKITVEDVAVKLWKMWPSEFCMRGYPQYPNVDIQKYITKLLDNHLIVGGVFNYKITEKGKKYVEDLIKVKKEQKQTASINQQPRYIKSEYIRIINSKIFKYYSKGEIDFFVESDLFEFLGTSARSLHTKDKNVFLARYNIITKDLIPFCKKFMKQDENARKIVELWNRLSTQFKELLNTKVKK